MHTDIHTYFHIARIFIYVWVAYEVVVTGFLYFTANQKMKSKIIKELSNFLISTAIFFGMATTLPFLAAIESDLYETLTSLMVVPAFFMASSARKFRNISIDNTDGHPKSKLTVKEK